MTKRPVEPPSESERIPSELQATFGANFREARRNMGLSQEEVAKRAGMVQASVSEVEKGRHNATLSTLERLAKAVNHTVTVLLQPTPKPPSRD